MLLPRHPIKLLLRPQKNEKICLNQYIYDSNYRLVSHFGKATTYHGELSWAMRVDASWRQTKHVLGGKKEYFLCTHNFSIFTSYLTS